MSYIQRIFFSALFAPLFAGAVGHAAEFEVMDRFSVDGYSVLRGSADIPGGSFAVGGSTFAVQYGKVGIGTTGPAYGLEVIHTAGVHLSTTVTAGYGLYLNSAANVGIGTTNPAANLDVNGEIKVGYAASACTSNIAGTLRWYDGHMSVCNGANWRQLDNQPPPTITSITPASGPLAGATILTIAGSGFVSGAEVLIGGNPATGIGVAATQITVTTPASSSGTGAKELRITNVDGQYVAGNFIYNPLPTISSLTPDSGQTLRTTNITINGAGFISAAGLQVTIGGSAATSVARVSDTQITALAPAYATDGAQSVTVTDPAAGLVTKTGGFTYKPFATGGTITYPTGYTVHTFTGSGQTFTANFAGTVKVLVVAGGGGGGTNGSGNNIAGGGGGAGGLIYNAAYSVTAGQAIPVTVGTGGTTSQNTIPTKGNNSIFDSLTAYGGGYGAGYVSSYYTAATGGSGGGGSYNKNAGASGTSGQGFAGGTGTDGTCYPSGGGGGAGGAGLNYSGSAGGNGGVGLAYDISGTSTYYAGGGGGGSGYTGCGGPAPLGGNGGGGAGSTSTNGTAGTANTGGGGGGAGNNMGAPYSNSWGGAGGSGIVIVRYPN